MRVFERAKEYAHGTRACYVSHKCRCRPCKDANKAYYHARQAALAEALKELEPGPPDDAPVIRMWKMPGRAPQALKMSARCPGLPANGSCYSGSYLRSDSKGGICSRCRELLLFNGLVSAGPARAHLLRLSRAGVGYKTVGDAGTVAKTVLLRILNGTKRQIRAETERKILTVTTDARADGSHVSGKRTRKRLDALLERGWTKTELARRLGSKSKQPALQLKQAKVTAATALAVEKLWRALAEVEPPPRKLATKDSAWGVHDAAGLQRHLSCKGKGCATCQGEGYRRTKRAA